ncbi:hypothetical protein KM043_011786 [Ampulex compressa]|nr:hypothetical protein KM043_011786 [Ampulex compressa]
MYRNILQVTSIQLLSKRFFNKDQVRVRFAPSPTGLLHLGSLRTALYNYLFARANNGTFILRIEDTDLSRTIPGAMEKIQDDLLWAGIIPDEDPTRGGPVGPYIQSKRFDLYKEQVLKLLQNESAYYCFCTKNRLELLKKDARKCGQTPKYDNKCRHLSKDEIKAHLKDDKPYCIRFKLIPTPDPFHDMIYGPIVHNVALSEGDPVIMKADGFPTYHFANVVDDHFMNISHVLRGIEWQISTPKHILLYKAFDWKPPKFGHLPLILNSNGTKLSKRQGDIQIDFYRKNGIFPLALLNFITYVGGGFNRESTDSYICSYQDLIKQFDVSNIKPSSGKLIPGKLLECNKLEISKLLTNEKNNKFLLQKVEQLVKNAFPDREDDESIELDEQYVMMVLNWAKNRISTLGDLVSPELKFLWVLPTMTNIADAGCSAAIQKLTTEMTEIDKNNFNAMWLNSYLHNFADNNDVQYPLMMKTLRNVLSNLKDGPPVAEMMEMLGKERSLMRIKRCIS